ncbi:hypothetical protein LQU74_09590 [Actinobacillus pleuropneumoniae]|nr:hypothetical protein [Actinobacillus pleuropneumoniae]MCL7712768.1 hypothetical protein [Actinobacillus pleuropneumoniae]MCL7741647.1 hypothetical protein [Actinobacillus pleuropneumoniae]
MLDKAENENDPSSMMFVAIEYCKDGNIEKAFYWKEGIVDKKVGKKWVKAL